MSELLGLLRIALPWYVTSLALAAAAVPLLVRMGRVLPDRGMGLAPVVGLALPTWLAWWWAHPGLMADDTMARVVRGLPLLLLVVLVAGYAIARVLGSDTSSKDTRNIVLAGVAALLALGIVAMPFGAGTLALAAAALLAAGLMLCRSACISWKREWRTIRLPLLCVLVLYTIGFGAVVLLRAAMPEATWSATYYGAEKMGNMMYLARLTMTDAMPPADGWFAGLTMNYYYGGHLGASVLAQVSATKPTVAFNLAQASLFGMILCAAFSLGYGLFAFVRPGRRVAAGMMTAFLVAVAGNLDALVQVIARVDFDFWRSSRAVHGAPSWHVEPATITEFPAFSALLGDLHAHHMVAPLTLAALAVVVGILRTARVDSSSLGARLNLLAPPLLLLGMLMAWIIPTNTWDFLVLAPLLLLALVVAMRRLVVSGAMRLLTWIALMIVGVWLVGLVGNLFLDQIAVFVPWWLVVAAGAALLLGGWLTIHGADSEVAMLAAGSAVLLMAVGVIVHPALEGVSLAGKVFIIVRDTVLLGLAVGGTGLLALRGGACITRAVVGVLVAGIPLGIALTGAAPFLSAFHSPIATERTLFVSLLPPILDAPLLQSVALAPRVFWQATPIRPLPADLATTLREIAVHFGLFLLPLAVALIGRTIIRRRGLLRRVLLPLALFVATACTLRVYAGSWVGPLAMTTAACLLVSAFCQRRLAGQVMLLFAGTSFAVAGFTEFFYVNDSYSGVYVRYNTVFKLWYPVWSLMAVAAVASLCDFLSVRSLPRTIVVMPLIGVLLVLGLLYPVLGSKHRLHRSLHALPSERLLDATKGLAAREGSEDDAALVHWLHLHARANTRLLEAPPNVLGSTDTTPDFAAAYSPVGRVAAYSGVPTLLGWTHHELQWRGWDRYLHAGEVADFLALLTLDDLHLLDIAPLVLPADPTREHIAGLKQLAARAPQGDLLDALVQVHDPDDATTRDLAVLLSLDARIGCVAIQRFANILAEGVDAFYRDSDWTPEARAVLRAWRPDFIVVGSIERTRYGHNSPGFAKFADWEVVAESGDARLYRVPAEALAP